MRKSIYSLAASTVLSACAAAPDGPPPEVEWRREVIVQIGPASSVPSYADQHCLEAVPPEARRRDEVLILYFRVGRSRYYQAFPTAPDEGWKVGERMMFDSRTCRIRRVANSVG